MNNRRTQNLWRILAAQAAIGLMMFLLGLSIVFLAQGFRFNYKNFKITKTGLIYLVSNQKSADIFINGKLVSKKSPFSQTEDQGYYEVEIKKSGFLSWRSVIKVEPEIVSAYKNIILFKENPETEELTDPIKIKLANLSVDLLANEKEKELLYNDYEIWAGGELVTRFSSPLSKALWYPDFYHIVYQQGNEIRVIEKSGQNDTLLVKLSAESTPTNFALNNEGNELYYLDGAKYKLARIR